MVESPPSTLRTQSTARTRFVFLSSEPEHQLSGAEVLDAPQDAAVPRVVLIGDFQQQIALEGIAGADFNSRDRRVPWRGGGGSGDVAETHVIDSGRRVQARHDLVAPFDR